MTPQEILELLIFELSLAADDHDYNPDSKLRAICRKAGIIDYTIQTSVISSAQELWTLWRETTRDVQEAMQCSSTSVTKSAES